MLQRMQTVGQATLKFALENMLAKVAFARHDARVCRAE
jgi:hypothetical protein